jgi:uncharacterized membrane protein YuzA (DUF378 family)
MKYKKLLKQIAEWSILVGGIAWGLLALNVDLIGEVASAVQQDWLPQAVYIIVGLSAVYALFEKFKK